MSGKCHMKNHSVHQRKNHLVQVKNITVTNISVHTLQPHEVETVIKHFLIIKLSPGNNWISVFSMRLLVLRLTQTDRENSRSICDSQ